MLLVFAVLAAILLVLLPKFTKNDAANMGQACNMAPEKLNVDSDGPLFKPACFVDLKEMTADQKKLVIETGLQNAAVLRAWELCGSEIRAVISAQERLGALHANFNRPFAAPYSAAVLEQAAKLAGQDSSVCSGGTNALDKVHKARVTVIIGGDRHDAIVSDYDVMGATGIQWPMEYFQLTNLCRHNLAAASEQAQEMPDDFERTVALINLDAQSQIASEIC